ncbi:MAG: YcfL family protein [Burkholderiales bacterium]|nr:YcfL family protein [Burkholderiales bacterium]
MKAVTLVIALLAVALAAGCSTKKGFEKPGFAFGCPIGDAKISSMSDLVKAKVAKEGSKSPDVEMEEIRCTTTGDLLKIDVVVYNDESDVERLQYKFRWMDAEGMRAADEESWKPLLLYGNSRQTVTTIAPNAKARDFKFIVMGQD